jgi:hypothetical protein
MRDAAQKLGYDLSVLKKVQQQGCTYPDISSGSSSSSNSNAGDSKAGAGSSSSSSASGQSG